MDTVTYPNDETGNFIGRHLTPVKLHVKQHADTARDYLATWTPNIVVADAEGRIHYRLEGYLPPETFVGRLSLAVGRFRFNRGEYDAAAERFEEVARRHTGTAAGAEAAYWQAVVDYKRSGDVSRLLSGWKKLRDEYPDTEWAERANVPKA
jgi:hypothetical protein